MQQAAIVIDIQEDQAVLRAMRRSACGGCPGKASCSTMGAWAQRTVEIRVANTVDAKIGDEVDLEVPDGWFLATCLRLYGLPMLAFLAAGLVLHAAVLPVFSGAADLVAAAGALLAMGLVGWHGSRRRLHAAAPLRMTGVRARGVSADIAVL